jgi:hypothetical protein
MVKTLRSYVIGAISNFSKKVTSMADKDEEGFLDLLRNFAASILNSVPSDKPYKMALFDALNKKQPTFAMEGVLIRESPVTGELEVYLTQRSMSETAYPGEFHAPGSGLRNKEDWKKAAERLARSEYKVPVKKVTVLFESCFFYDEARGWYCSVPCLIELDGEPIVGKWYSVDHLPDKTVGHHRDDIIPAVVRYWRNREAYDTAITQAREAIGL